MSQQREAHTPIRPRVHVVQLSSFPSWKTVHFDAVAGQKALEDVSLESRFDICMVETTNLQRHLELQ